MASPVAGLFCVICLLGWIRRGINYVDSVSYSGGAFGTGFLMVISTYAVNSIGCDRPCFQDCLNHMSLDTDPAIVYTEFKTCGSSSLSVAFPMSVLKRYTTNNYTHSLKYY